MSIILYTLKMSQISKARDRMLKRSQAGQSEEQEEQTFLQTKPRKFTVSSLTHRLESDPHPYSSFTPETPPPRSKHHTPSRVQTHRDNTTSTPLLKTIHIKIDEVHELNSRREQDYERSPASRFQESPPKMAHRRTLHREQAELILAPPAERRHHSPFKPRQTLREWADSVLAQNKGHPFRDDFFPPARSIVFNKKILYQEEGLKFQRLGRIYSSNSTAVIDSCEPTLLSLSKYTNPYLYSALTILAEDPTIVLPIFGGQTVNEEGIYYLNLCKDGVWRFVIIDDHVPVKSIAGRKQMLFLHSRQSQKGTIQIWPTLLEKAVAKIYGTYLDLAMVREEGMLDIFKLLTGAPTSVYDLNKDFRSFLIIIDTALKRNHIVTLEGIKDDEGDSVLSQHQAYRILSIKKTGIKIRNMSEPDLTTKLTFAECLIFSRLIIYRLEKDYRYVTHKLRHKRGYYSQLKLSVPSATRCYIDVWQNNPAYYKKHLGSHIDYEQGKVRMWIGQEEEGEWLEQGKETVLEEGLYQLKFHLCQRKQMDFTVSYYGEKDVALERVKVRELWKEPCQCN